MSKLVRDLIPDAIRASGDIPVVTIASPVAYRAALLDKLVEEALEARAAVSESGSTLAGLGLEREIADVLEVIAAICCEWAIDPDIVDGYQASKRRTHGGFGRRFILHEEASALHPG